MTLEAFFELLAAHPVYILAYFGMIPLTALLAGWLGKNEGHLPPWKYLYSTLIYLVCVPGLFAVTLNVYLFLFERRSIFEIDLYTQVLPVFSMIVTLIIIRNNVSLSHVPGFDKLSGFMMMIISILVLMWLADKTRILVFSYMPIQYVLLIFIGLLLLFRFGVLRLVRGKAT